jgi:hypothetical protein
MFLNCNTGYITRHDNFESVFDIFPERISSNVHGYVATADCDDVGKLGFIIVGDEMWKILVADCLSDVDKKKNPLRYTGWVMDLDSYLYYAAKVKDNQNRGTLCLIKNGKE